MVSKRLVWNGPTLTFVAPWYGRDVPGGAELQCRRTAEELCARGVRADVWTTTAGGLHIDWTAPSFAPGETIEEGVRVRRFPVRPRDSQAFDRVNLQLLQGRQPSLSDEAVFVQEIIASDDLNAAIADESQQRVFVFIPYMFGTTYWGARMARRAYIIPCFHDEPYARMQVYQQLLEGASGLLFYSPAEERLARSLLRLPPAVVLGAGVETAMVGDGERFRATYGIDGPFIVYAGRRDPTKNTPLLFEAFRAYRAAGGSLALVCLGGPGIPVPEDLIAAGSAFDLGFVPAQDKYDAYAAATLLCQPSRNESFSLVTMEAWVCGTPTLVHSDCAVTREFSIASGGGLHFRTHEEFAAVVDWLATHPEAAARMGRSGRRFVLETFAWDAVTRRLVDFLRATGAERWL